MIKTSVPTDSSLNGTFRLTIAKSTALTGVAVQCPSVFKDMSSFMVDPDSARTTAYGLDDGGIGVRDPVRARLVFVHVVQTGSGAHPVSYLMCKEDSFSGGNVAGREADHSTPTNAEVKNTWIYTPTPQCTFMA
jgi:hypothetical protein